MYLSNVVKDWIIEFKDSDRKPIYITGEVAQRLNRTIKSGGSAEIQDGKGNLIDIIQKTEIKGIHPSNEKPADLSGTPWVCNYGTRHSLTENECNCRNNFKVSYLDFLSWCQINFNIEHSYQIESHMQEVYLKNNPLIE